MNAQYFLPILDPANSVKGIVGIPVTTFTGSEPTITVGPETFPLKRMTYRCKLSGLDLDYMAIAASWTDVRAGWAMSRGNDLFAFDSIHDWRNYGLTTKTHQVGDLEFFLLGYVKAVVLTATPGVLPTPPTTTDTSMERTFNVNAPFTNAPRCEFFDVSWSALSGLSDVTKIQSVNIGPASADPGTGTSLKLMLVYPNSVTVAGGIGLSNLRTMRIRKNGVTPGVYTWPITVLTTAGTTINLTYSVTVP